MRQHPQQTRTKITGLSVLTELSSLSSTGHTLKKASELAGESHPKNCLHAIHRKKTLRFVGVAHVFIHL